jgi:hypothetical protein
MRRRLKAQIRRLEGWLSYLVDARVSPRVKVGRSLILTGFWRSGTTWLQQVLARLIKAKTIFEPLSPIVLFPSLQPKQEGVHSVLDAFLHAFMPYHPIGFDRDLKEYMERAIKGNLPGGWLRVARNNVAEAFRTAVVMKLVRGQLCLGALREMFGCPIVHVRRDPRAVLASVSRRRFWKGWLDSISLSDLLLGPEDGRREHFARWSSEIGHYDKKSPIEKVAAYWALTEGFVDQWASGNQDSISILRYEGVLREGVHSLRQLLMGRWGGHESGHTGKMSHPSPTVLKWRRHLSADVRIKGWRKELDAGEIRKIEQAVEVFGFGKELHVSEPD